MGQNRGGYQQVAAISPEQQSLLSQILGQAGRETSGPGSLGGMSNDVLRSFLTGSGFEPIKQAAQTNFQQQTIPSILNAFGSQSKTNSGLNQALAAGGANLNTNLAAQLAQMQLGAANQAHQQAFGPAQLGLGTQPFAYQQSGSPFWQELLLGGISGGSRIAASAAGGG